MGSPTKSKILAIAPKFTAFLSMCGSTGIVTMVSRSPRRRKQIMHRIMLGLSVADILASIWYFAGTWPIPAGTLSWFGDGETETIFWAAGDQNGVACNFSGFFNQFAVASPLYNATLAWYYLLTVYYGWDDRRLSRIEWMFHAIPYGYALITATFAVAADLYGHVEWTCWILPNELFDDSKDLTPIQAKFQWIQWIFLFGVVWVCIVFVTVIFVVLYRKMKAIEKKMMRFSYVPSGVSGISSTHSGARRLSNDSEARRTSSVLSNDSFSTNDSVARRLSNDSVARRRSSMLSEGGNEEVTKPEGAPVKESTDIVDAATSRGEEEKVGDDYFADDAELDYSFPAGAPDVESAVEGGIQQLGGGRQSNEERIIETHGDKQKEADKFNDDGVDEEMVAENGDRAPPGANANVKERKQSRVSWHASSIVASTVAKPAAKRRRTSDGRREIKQQYKEQSKSRKIAIQGMLYVVAFYVTWLFPTISRITELIAGKNFFVIQFFDTFLIPLQGALNFAIYIRPRLRIYRKSNPKVAFWRALKAVTFEAKD